MQMRHLKLFLIPSDHAKEVRTAQHFSGATGRSEAKVRQRDDASGRREVSKRAAAAVQLPVAEEPQWSGQTVVYDDFWDSSPDFHMGTQKELSAVLPGDPIPSASVTQAFVASSSAKYLGVKPVAASGVSQTEVVTRCATSNTRTEQRYRFISGFAQNRVLAHLVTITSHI